MPCRSRRARTRRGSSGSTRTARTADGRRSTPSTRRPESCSSSGERTRCATGFGGDRVIRYVVYENPAHRPTSMAVMPSSRRAPEACGGANAPAAKRGGSSMAALSPWQKHVQSVLRQGGTMKQASKSFRAKGGKPAGKNPRGVPLSSKTGKYRPSVPKGPIKKVVGAVKKQYKKALAKASKIGRKKA